MFGMSMTEKQGGSDVRANTTVADAGRTRRPGCGVPAHRAQVVLLGADVRRLPGARSGQRRCRRGTFVLPAAARPARRHAQRLPHPAAQGQAGQQVQRVVRDRTRRHRRRPDRRTGSRRAHHHRDGRPAPDSTASSASTAGMRQSRRRGALARTAPVAFGAGPGRSAGDDRGAGRSGARVRGRDGHRTAIGPRARRGRGRAASRRSADSRPRSPSTGSASAVRTTPTRPRVPGRQRVHRGLPARPSLPRAAGHGRLGGVRQRHRARRAARDDPRTGERRGLCRRARAGAGRATRCSTRTST